MAEKKNSKDWYIAMTFFLTAGFLIPVLASIVFSLMTIPFIGMDAQGNPVNPQAQIPLALADGVVGALSIWFGIKYASKYIHKKYVVPRPMHIVNLATIYFFLSGIIFSTLFARSLPLGDPQGISLILLTINSVEYLIDTCIFYFVSKKELVLVKEH